MENSAVYNDQITSLDTEDFFIQAYQTTAGFNIDQFHLIMPVVIERMEDLAVVCIGFYWKLKRAVRASFFESVIYFNWGSNWHGRRLLLFRDF